jgi:endo-1,4-beta-xylanase
VTPFIYKKEESKMTIQKSLLLILSVAMIFSCTPQEPRTLKEAFEDHFVIGTALGGHQINGGDSLAIALTIEQFNTITAENDMKFGPIHPEKDRYNFETADRFVEFGEQHDMFVVGHVLVWHSQTSRWIFTDENGNDVDREELLARMKNHIDTVVGRYKGRVHGWDVLNEALNEDGTLRQSKWLQIIGEDYIDKAFQFAHEADPEAELYYNDYNMHNEDKSKGAVRIVENLLDKGIRVDGIGMQAHWGLDYPTVEQAEASILRFAELGVNVMITEMDINVLPSPWQQTADVSFQADNEKAMNPYVDGLPDSVQQKLTDQYAKLFALFVKHSDKISRVTFWGTHDGHSWKNNWPVRGRTNYPLIFDRQYQPKPAYYAIMYLVK